MELGLSTFGEIHPDGVPGHAVNAHRRVQELLEEAKLADALGLDVFALDDYDDLFSEKLELLLLLREKEIISWKGKHRASIPQLGVYPRPYQEQLPVWVAVGGTPRSVIRAGALNLPLTIAILGGMPRQFVPLVNLYREAAKEAGHLGAALPLAVNAHLYVADSSEQAADEFWPTYEKLMNRIGKERGWQPLTRRHFDQLRAPEGPLLVGSVEEVTEKIVFLHDLFRNTRYMAQTISGEISHAQLMHSIRLFGAEVAPAVRERVAG